MSNALNLLMNCNQEVLKKPTKEIELTRLSEAMGEPFKVTVQAINLNQFKQIMEGSGIADQNATSSIEASAQAVKLGLIDPKLTDKKLQEQLGAPNWEELMNKLFLTGEVMQIAEGIMEISQLEAPQQPIKKNSKKK